MGSFGDPSLESTPEDGMEDEDASEILVGCTFCGRTFAPENLLKHEDICRKVFRKKNCTFNSFKQRTKGMPASLVTSSTKEPCKRSSNWRAAHEDFINCIISAREVTKAMKEGQPLPPPPPPSINPDYVQCPHCMRRFNEIAGARHINFCKEKASRQTIRKPASRVPSKTTIIQGKGKSRDIFKQRSAGTRLSVFFFLRQK
ncbi:zinc finger C2HC domain-containing protein 1B [Rhinatrema bivittatum]|uniref:zinc finger C2HC domain-containing protein 1B n=1 Tax=Rhinatrema bivittatum TaxID=194408 RepID=UPI00112E8AEA|nr:zinc finger C2HC domain-containing protein 1B [Rhinatrema bivittatum]